MVGIASLTVLHLWTSNFLQDIEKRRLAGLAIAQHDINDEFEFWESRSQEAIRGDFTFFGSREQFISQMRGALYFGAEEIKGHKQRLIDGGVDRQMVEDLHGVMVASQPDARTIPEDGLAPFIEYTMRNTRQRLEKEILRAQAD